MDLWVQVLIRHGVTSFWLYDCLYDLPTMQRMAKAIHDAGGTPVPSVMYGLTDVHTDDFFASRAREMATWPGVTSIYVEDAAGVLTPERAATLLPSLRAATGNVKLEIHCHNTTGLAQHNYVEAIAAGFTMIHTASRPMANGPSLPSTEGMIPILEHLGYDHDLDVSQLEPVERTFLWAAQDAGFAPGAMAEFDPRIYDHQLPGGMTGTLKNQLAQHGMSHRLPEVLAEIPRVRRELGQPVMATPFSQFMGVQSVLNVITGDRYSLVPDEVIQYVLGHYGPVPSVIDPDVLDRILTQPRAGMFRTWVQPQPTLAEVRGRFGSGICDEELLLRLMTSDREVDEMLAVTSQMADRGSSAGRILGEVAGLLRTPGAPTAISVTGPNLRIHAQRQTLR